MPAKKPAKSKRKPATKKKKVIKKEKELIEQRVEHFTEEIEVLGKKMERRGKEWETWFHRNFGIIGPFFSSILSLIIFIIVILAIGFINLPLGSAFMTNLESFLTSNIERRSRFIKKVNTISFFKSIAVGKSIFTKHILEFD